jgi:penicillin-binding protein 1A
VSTSAERLKDALLALDRACVDAVATLELRPAEFVAAARALLARRTVRVVAQYALGLLVLPPVWLVHHLYFDRTGVPNAQPLIRFEMPRTGQVYDASGQVLIELAREYRRVIPYDEIPYVVRAAVLSAEDQHFFRHSGVDYTALPRVLWKTTWHSLSAWGESGGRFKLMFPQGGSTLTQQLVRGYFLRDRTSRENGDTLFPDGLVPRLLSFVFGVPSTNKLMRKLEEARLAFWLEEEMIERYGSKELAKREIFARYASFIYLGYGRYGFAASSEYYFGKPLSNYTLADAPRAALLAGIAKAPRDYSPAPGNRRPVKRRDMILALMARNQWIPDEVMRRAQLQPVRVVAHGRVKTQAPAAIENVLSELRQHSDSGYGVRDLVDGRVCVHSTVDARIQAIVNRALENGLALYEQRHPEAAGLIQGSAVILRNSDAGILAVAGGRQVYKDQYTSYTDMNRVTRSLRQPGSAMKPLVYFAAFRSGLGLDARVADAPIGIWLGRDRGVKWISNYDRRFKGLISVRQALAESRNTVAVRLAREIGMDKVLRTASELGIRTRLQPYVTTALGASEVRLLELANAYRAMASGVVADPHIIARLTDHSGAVVYQAQQPERQIPVDELRPIQEGLRGVVRLPGGTAHALASRDFPIPVMGKTGTTSDFRDALFVGSTYGPEGITVAVRVGFDDNRPLGEKETGGRAALPVFRQIMLEVYSQQLTGPPPAFPREIESAIDGYLAARTAAEAAEPAAESSSPAPGSDAAPEKGSESKAAETKAAETSPAASRSVSLSTSAH